MSRPDDDDDDVPRERLILVNVIEARAPPPPLPLGKKNVVVVVIAKKVARFFSSSRLLPRVTLVSRFSVCLSLLSRRKRKKVFFVEKVPSSSLFFCGAECTKRKKKDMRKYTYSKVADQDTNKDTQRYTADSLSEYPEYLRDSSHVLIASLLNIPLTHLLIFHLFSGALLRCYS